MKRDLLDALLAARQGKRVVVVATRLSAGPEPAQQLIDPYMPLAAATDGPYVPLTGTPAEQAELVAAARRAAERDESVTITTARGDIFLGVYSPPKRLIIVGAVHIAQALAPMAAIAGFEVIVVDPRAAFATAERFPGITVRTDWPDEAFRALAIDRRTAVVTLTHDPKIDEPALVLALGSTAFYIGALGSKKTQASRVARLGEQGFDDAALARIKGPVGLRIGARSAAEIAVSILAEIIEQLRRADS